MKRILTRIPKRIWRDRRRMAFVAICLFLIGYISFWDSSGNLLGLSVQSGAGYAFIIGILPFAILISLILPSWRFSLEICAFGLMLVALTVLILPGNWRFFDNDYSALNLFGVMMILMHVLATIVHGKWSQKRWVSRKSVYRGICYSHLSQEELWRGLAPLPENVGPNGYGDEDTLSLRWLEAGKVVELRGRCEPAGIMVEINTLQEHIPGSYLRFHYQAQDAEPGAHGTSGIVELRISDQGDRRCIERSLSPDNSAAMLRLTIWLDDGLARLVDSSIEVLEDRAATPSQSGAMSPAARPA